MHQLQFFCQELSFTSALLGFKYNWYRKGRTVLGKMMLLLIHLQSDDLGPSQLPILANEFLFFLLFFLSIMMNARIFI